MFLAPFRGLLVRPPVARVEDEDVGGPVSIRRRLDQIQPERFPALPLRVHPGAFPHQERRPEELDRAVVVLRGSRAGGA